MTHSSVSISEDNQSHLSLGNFENLLKKEEVDLVHSQDFSLNCFTNRVAIYQASADQTQLLKGSFHLNCPASHFAAELSQTEEAPAWHKRVRSSELRFALIDAKVSAV